MENLFGIDIQTRKRAQRNLLMLLRRDHGSEIMLKEMYEWYMSLDDETEEGIRQIMASLPEAQEKFAKTTSVATTTDFSQDLSYRDMIELGRVHGISGIANYRGRSKWDRIGRHIFFDTLDMALIVAPIPNWKSKVMASQRQIRRLNELMS